MGTHISYGLEGRVAVVTGGAQGIGEACMRRLRQEGAHVVIADVASEKGHALAEATGALFVHTDVGNKMHVDALVARVLQTHQRIDILVNNAGITKDNLLIRMKEEEWDAVIAVNLKGTPLEGFDTLIQRII
jgi:NAD(P)-dependent dehydrogenase (short-subunit alcohol dehydrogenase family)